jgi:hypothetical protein
MVFERWHQLQLQFVFGHILRIFAPPRRDWHIWNHPTWLTEQFYSEQIQPGLRAVEVKTIAAALGVSIPYATYIRAGRRRPHPRHWLVLAQIMGLGNLEKQLQT